MYVLYNPSHCKYVGYKKGTETTLIKYAKQYRRLPKASPPKDWEYQEVVLERREVVDSTRKAIRDQFRYCIATLTRR